MKILYQAEDGTIFEEEYACYTYECLLKFPELKNIIFFDKDNKSFHIENNDDIFDDKYYNICEKILIHNDIELSCLHWLSIEAGWCEFEQITEPGYWIRSEIDGNGIWHVTH